MRKIIVPVDFSEYSENALKTAVHIAKKNNAEIIVVHMLELEETYFFQSESYIAEQFAFYTKLAEKNFEKFLDKDYLKDVKVSYIIKHNKIFKELNKVVDEESADLIVMGSQGASELKEVFIGSNTEKVVRNSDVPVLVVKEEPVLTDFKKVLFALDFDISEVRAYKEAVRLFEKLGCEVKLLYVNTPDARFRTTVEQEKHVEKFLAKVEKKHEVKFIDHHSMEDGVFEQIPVEKSDLIALVTHSRKGLDYLFKNTSGDVANHSETPVITFKA